MTACAIGATLHTQPEKAFEDAFQQIISGLSGQLPNFIFCFSKFNTEEIQSIAQKLKDHDPQALIVGSHAQSFNSTRRFTLVLYAISSDQLQATSRVFPLTNSPLSSNEPASDHTFILACAQSTSIDSLLSAITPASQLHSVVGIVGFGPQAWIMHNDTIFQDMAIRIDLTQTKINFYPWHVSIPIGLPQSFASNNNICDLISNMPAAHYYQRYISKQLSSLPLLDQQQIFATYPLCFQQKQSYQFISPLAVGPQDSLILPVAPPPQANMVTLALENTAFPDELIKQAIQNAPVDANRTPLLFTSAVSDFPAFINNREQMLFANESYPEPLRISTQGLIFNNPSQPPIYTSHGRLLLNIS